MVTKRWVSDVISLRHSYSKTALRGKNSRRWIRAVMDYVRESVSEASGAPETVPPRAVAVIFRGQAPLTEADLSYGSLATREPAMAIAGHVKA